MSDDKRKSARLQGRFSDEHKPVRKDRPKRFSDSYTDDNSSRTSTGKGRKSDPKPLQAAEGFNVKYDKNASPSFQPLEERVKPVEISKKGVHVLSITENGKSRVIFEPDFIPKEKAGELMTILRSSTTWYDKNIVIHGKEFPQPRLVAWYGPFPYAYSGAILDAAEMPPLIEKIKDDAEKYLEEYGINVKLNSVLLNLYRDEKDSVAWHSDDELSLGCSPTIASVSLGAVRKFEMRAKPHVPECYPDLESTDYFINLTPGSLVVMDGCMQKDWRHRVPKEYHDRCGRINLTFRTVYPSNKLPVEVPLKSAEKSDIFSPSVREERPHIFDNDNFPPLGSSCGPNESGSKKTFQNSFAEQSKKGSSKPSENFPADMWDSGEEDDDPFLNSETNRVPQNINKKPLSTASQNGSSFITAGIAIADSLIEKVPYISEVPITDNTLRNKNEYNKSLANNNSNDSSCIDNSFSNTVNKSFELNANAPDFVPTGRSFSNRSSSHSSVDIDIDYSKMNLQKLAETYQRGDVPNCRFEEFTDCIFNTIDENQSFFLDRDHYELKVLFDLSDGTQTLKNQAIILERICSMIQNGVSRHKKHSSLNYSGQSNRPFHRDGNRPSRGAFRGSSHRSRNYNDKD